MSTPSRRTFQEAGAHAMSMTDDWASAFRPVEEEVVEEPVEETLDEPVDQPTIADINEILISLKVIHDENIDLRKRVRLLEQMVANPPWLNDLNSNLQAVLRDNASAMVGANNQFMAILIRKLDELEERLSSDDPAFTNILYSNPELFNEISSRPDEEDELSVEEEFAAKEKIAEMVQEEHPELLTTGEESISELAQMGSLNPMSEEEMDASLTAAQEEMLAELNGADHFDGTYERLRTKFEQDNHDEKRIRASFDAWKAKEIKWHEFVKAAGGVKNAGMWKKRFTEESSL